MKKKGQAKLPPKEHWEVLYDISSPSENMYATQGSDFNAKCPTDRKTTHIKVNETDH